MAKTNTLTHVQCKQCRSEQVTVLSKMQFYLMLSLLPYLVILILTFVVHPITLLFIPIIHFINNRSAKKKTPFVICKSCKHISQGE